jgi:hypothetical protein
VQRIGVAGRGEGGHVGFEPIDDGAGLLARAAMALFDGHILTGLGLPVFGESSVVFDVQLTGWVVGHIEQRDRGGLRLGVQGGGGQGTGKHSFDERAAGFHGAFFDVERTGKRIMKPALKNWNVQLLGCLLLLVLMR